VRAVKLHSPGTGSLKNGAQSPKGLKEWNSGKVISIQSLIGTIDFIQYALKYADFKEMYLLC
jgi:hypothetical protein